MTHKLSGSDGENSGSANASLVVRKQELDTPISNTANYMQVIPGSQKCLNRHAAIVQTEDGTPWRCGEKSCKYYTEVKSVVSEQSVSANTELPSELAPPHPSNTAWLDELLSPQIMNEDTCFECCVNFTEAKTAILKHLEEAITAKLAEIEREARIDEHRVLDELAEQTANVDPDKAIDNYGAAKDRRLAALKHQGGE